MAVEIGIGGYQPHACGRCLHEVVRRLQRHDHAALLDGAGGWHRRQASAGEYLAERQAGYDYLQRRCSSITRSRMPPWLTGVSGWMRRRSGADSGSFPGTIRGCRFCWSTKKERGESLLLRAPSPREPLRGILGCRGWTVQGWRLCGGRHGSRACRLSKSEMTSAISIRRIDDAGWKSILPVAARERCWIRCTLRACIRSVTIYAMQLPVSDFHVCRPRGLRPCAPSRMDVGLGSFRVFSARHHARSPVRFRFGTRNELDLTVHLPPGWGVAAPEHADSLQSAFGAAHWNCRAAGSGSDVAFRSHVRG